MTAGRAASSADGQYHYHIVTFEKAFSALPDAVFGTHTMWSCPINDEQEVMVVHEISIYQTTQMQFCSYSRILSTNFTNYKIVVNYLIVDTTSVTAVQIKIKEFSSSTNVYSAIANFNAGVDQTGVYKAAFSTYFYCQKVSTLPSNSRTSWEIINATQLRIGINHTNTRLRCANHISMVFVITIR